MYRILDRDSVPEYLMSLPNVVDVLGTTSNLVIDEIGDGNLNFVYRVTNGDEPGRSVILKQAVPYLRLAGEDWPLSRDRMTFEIRALQLYNELVPEFVPTIFHADEEMSALVMQNLSDHIILRLGMIDGVTYPKVATDIGVFMAETLFRTSAWGMDSEDRRQLMDRFTLNSELCKLTEDFIFTFPYMTHESNYESPETEAWADANLRNNAAYKLDVLRFKDLFVAKTDALLHADLHSGSLMVNQDETFVIDMEFAYFGPFGFDVGKIISNFILCCTAHHHLPGGAEYREWLLDQIVVIWDTFSARFRELWDQQGESAMLTAGLLSAEEDAQLKDAFMAQLLQESAGFAACSMARRTLGIAGVADIRDIEDPVVRSNLEIANLELSMLVMANRTNLSSIGDLLTLVRDFYSQRSLDS